MIFENFLELTKKTRSIRKYIDKEVPDEIINSLIECALYAPASYGRKPWKFYIIKNKDTKEELRKKEVFFNDFVYDAPLIILNCVEIYPLASMIIEKRKKWLHNDMERILLDTPTPLDYIRLGATAHGLASCYIALIDREKAAEVFCYDEKKHIIPLALTLGYPAENPTPRRRKSLENYIVRI